MSNPEEHPNRRSEWDYLLDDQPLLYQVQEANMFKRLMRISVGVRWGMVALAWFTTQSVWVTLLVSMAFVVGWVSRVISVAAATTRKHRGHVDARDD